MNRTLLSLGHGYSAEGLESRLLPRGWQIIGTTRSSDKASAMQARGITPLIWPGTPLPLDEVSHVLSSIAPREGHDPVLAQHGPQIAETHHLKWVGYLSTIGVYGDRQGGWVDEDTNPDAKSERARARVKAEAAWQSVCNRAGVPLHVFRLGGIYGPGRGPFAKLRAGRAERVVKPGQVFSRIHQDDIAQALDLAMHARLGSRIFNLCDDTPAPPQDVLAHAARLLGIMVPPEVPFDQADLSPMARSFYADNKRVRNDRVKRELGLELRYPDYQSGLAAILAAEG